MNILAHDDPLALSAIDLIQRGETTKLQQLLDDQPELASSSIQDPEKDCRRTLLHVATDWPGHFPNVAATIGLLTRLGANVDAGINGPNSETPLHWAASSDDVDAVDALIDAGANIDSQGAVIAGGDPLENAIGFQNWNAAKRLAQRGATTNLGDEAALGLLDRMKIRFSETPHPAREAVSYAFWNACCAGQLESAKYLMQQGAEINWVPSWCNESHLDGAHKSENQLLINWLTENGAKTKKSN